MSAISQKSISGITSITSPAGTDDQISLHTSNTNEALKIDGAGNLHLNNHVNTTGVTTASNFKTGSSNLHSTGLTVGDTFVHSTGINGSSADIDDFISVGSNIHLGNAGVVTATSFIGDGSDLTNLPAGLGTALSATASSPLNKMYYTNQVLGVPSSVTVDVPASASKAYTQYADIKVEYSADLIVAEGDDLIPDILGLADFGTFGGGASAGRIRVNSISNAANDGSPTVQKGLVVTGVTTSTTFSGSGASLTNLPSAQLTGALPALDGSNLTGLSGVSVANQADNRLITCTGTTDSLNGEQYLTYTSQSSLNNTDGNGTSLLGGNYLNLKRTTGNSNYINAPLADAELIISADESIIFKTVHTADFNSTERARIDSSGRVLIGTTTPTTLADELVVATSGDCGITIMSGTTHNGRLYFSDSGQEGDGFVDYDHQYGNLKLGTRDITRFTIDSSGLMGLGTNNPQKNLHLYSSGVATLRIETGDSRGQAWDILSTNGAQNNTGTLSFRDESGSSYVEFGANEGSPQFRVRNGGANDLLHVDSSGRVTTPYTVSFMARGMNGSTYDNGTMTGLSSGHNVGNHYNSSTGIFTAPVAGRYLTGCGILVQSGTGRLEGNISLNNSTSIVAFNGTGTTYDGPTATAIVQMSANDTLRVKRQSGNAYNPGHGNHYFFAHLLG